MRRILALFLCAAAPVAAQPGDWVDANRPAILREYVDLLAIPNVASNLADIRRNADLIVAMMARRGLSPRLLESADGTAPPLVYGEWLVPGATRTLILYAHYDGQPASPEAWRVTQPFVPLLLPGAAGPGVAPVAIPAEASAIGPEWRVYARSASDDKAGVMAILAAVDALRAQGRAPSFNLKIVFEGEEEAGSPNLAVLLRRHRDTLRSDGWVIIDGPAHQSGPPILSMGVRGIVTGEITVYGPVRPLHSGHYGNWAPNPALMLAQLLATMKNEAGRVLVPGFYDDVAPLSASERAAIAAVPPPDRALAAELGIGRPDGGGAALTALVHQPSLNITGLRSADVGANSRNVIPGSATASFDIRLVPGNDPARQLARVADHIRAQGFEVMDREPTQAERRRFARIARLDRGTGYRAERTSLDHPLARSLRAALGLRGPLVVVPSMGGSLPLYILREELGAPSVNVSLWNYDNSQHAEDENIRLQALWDGIRAVTGILTME